MKILMTTMSLGIGGAETHIVELAKELHARGNEVMIASGGGVYVPEIEAAGIRHFTVPMNRRSAVLMAKSFFLLLGLIRREKPDIVHAHARIPGFLCGLVRKFTRFHFVTTAHWVFDTAGLQGKLTNWGEKTVAVSEDIKTYLMDNYGTAGDNIFVTINGIDTEKFSPVTDASAFRAELGIPGSARVIGHVSRLDESRALAAKTLLDAAERIAASYPDAVILIVGGGNRFDSLLSEAEAINSRLGRKAVIMTGARTDINLACAASDIFTGVSRAALEAMSAGKPVILAGNEGCLGVFTPEKLDEAINTNFCCRDCPALTADGLYADIAALLDSTEEERGRLGAFGRELVCSQYSTARMASDTMRAYEAALHGRRITMSGYYGFGNAGDEAVLKSLLASIGRVFPDASVTVLSASPETTGRIYGCSAVKRFDPFRVFGAIRGCDTFISGGGSLLQDATSTRSLVYYVLLIRLAKLLGKKVMLYANGIGPVSKKMNRKRVRRAVELADAVTLRDGASLEELRGMGVSRGDIAVTADPVFMLSPADRAVGEAILRRAGVPDGGFVAVSIRPWRSDAAFRRGIAEICDGIVKKLGLSVVFLPMQPVIDERESEAVRSLMTEPAFILPASCTAEELMSVIGQSEFTLSMRLHSLIFAARAGVPSVGFTYDPKIDAYLDMLAEPNAGAVGALEPEKVLRLCEEIASAREQRVADLAQRREALIAAAKENEKLLSAVK